MKTPESTSPNAASTKIKGTVPHREIDSAVTELRNLIDRGGQLRKQELLENVTAPSIVANAALVHLVDTGEISLFRVNDVTKIRREHR